MPSLMSSRTWGRAAAGVLGCVTRRPSSSKWRRGSMSSLIGSTRRGGVKRTQTIFVKRFPDELRSFSIIADPDRGVMTTAVRGGLPLPTDRALWASVDDRGLLARAQAELGTPWPQPLAGQYARYRRDGDRVEYETRVFEREDRLTRAVVAALVTDDHGWVDEVRRRRDAPVRAELLVLARARRRGRRPGHGRPRRHRAGASTWARARWRRGSPGSTTCWATGSTPASPACAAGSGTRCARACSTRSSRATTGAGSQPPLSNWTAWIHANVLTAALVAARAAGARRRRGAGGHGPR